MTVYSAQLLIGGSGAFLAPTVAAITLGIVGASAFDKQFGKNQAFNSAGTFSTALLVAYVSYKFGYRAIFVIAALLAIPGSRVSFWCRCHADRLRRARGSIKDHGRTEAEGLSSLLKDRVLLCFLATGLSFSLCQRCDVAATGRDAIEG